MYQEGSLIYFDPFYFKNGDQSKPKYFLVLKIVDDNIILASLPSSVPHLPSKIAINHGCVEIPNSCINCYIFKKNEDITECGWSFEKDTFLYGQWIDEFKTDILNDIYKIEDVDYEVIGKLKKEEYKKVINCFTKSLVVKRKFKRLLTT